MATRDEVRQTRFQHNLQRLSIDELSLLVSLSVEQLTFPTLLEDERRATLFDAKADPKEARATRVFDPGVPVSYRCVETLSLPTHRFCWTVERNAAGRFLTFRERVTRTHIRRDQIEAFLNKRAAIRACIQNRNDLEARRAKRRAKRGGANGGSV